MAFILANLQPIGGQARRSISGTAETVPGAPQMWSYRTADAATAVDDAGYFNDAYDLLQLGDVVLRTTINGSGVVQSCGWHVVISRSADAIRVSDTTALTITNA